MATRNGLAAWFQFIAGLWEKEFVSFPLMVSFTVIMHAELGQSPGQRSLSKQNQLCQALVLNRPDPAFCKGIQIRTSGRKR